MIDETSILARLEDGADLLPPLRIRVAETQPVLEGLEARPDAFIELAWEGRSFRFVAECKRLATPRLLQDAISQVQRWSQATGLPPLIVVPYLGPEQLERLQAAQVSGIDLSGNGVVIVPSELLVFRTGQPNAFPASTGIRNIYAGVSSIIARVFLLRPTFEAVGEIRSEIRRRDGEVSPATVSKVLKGLEEDLIISRRGRISRLLQPDLLLEKLARSFQRPKVQQTRQFQWRGEQGGLEQALAEASKRGEWRLAVTGAASVGQYAVMPRERLLSCYCTDVGALVEAMGDKLTATDRFADLAVLETEDPLVYFDCRSQQDNGLPMASPVQTWLELQSGDKRERDAAEQVRRQLLETPEPVQREKP